MTLSSPAASFDVARLRPDFPILQTPYAHLDNGTSTQRPRPVIEAMTQLYEHHSSRTKLVAVTALSNVLGTINPLREIIAQAQAVGAKTLIDAAQSVPHAVTDVQALDCDFLAIAGHKMLGPTGVGVLYGREA